MGAITVQHAAGVRFIRSICSRQCCGHLLSYHENGKCKWRGCECTIPVIALTAREVDVIKCFAQGYSAKEAATSLNVGVKTIESHRFNISHKLGTQSTMQAVLAAIRSGVIVLEDLPDLGIEITASP